MKKCASLMAAILVAALLSGAAPLTGMELRADAARDVEAGMTPEDTAMPVSPPQGSDQDTSGPAPVPGEDSSGEDSALEAAALLHTLGIMGGVGINPDGSVDYALDKAITRQEAVTLIARAAGYDCVSPDIDFPHPFKDVSEFAQGSVGYAYQKGIARGAAGTLFKGTAQMTGRELVTFMLRALGYGDEFVWSEACAFSDSIGLTEGELGQGLETVTRGDTAKLMVKLLTAVPKGFEKNYLSRLVETGTLEREKVVEAGLESALYAQIPDSVAASRLSEKYKNCLVTVTAKDIMLKTAGSAHGTVLWPGIAAVPLDAVKGSMYITLTDAAGGALEFTGILGHDEERGIAYLGYKVREAAPAEGEEIAYFPAPLYTSVTPEKEEETGGAETEDTTGGAFDTAVDTSAAEPDQPEGPAPVYGKDDLIYAVSDMAVAFARGEDLCARNASVITDNQGRLLGIRTETGIWEPEFESGQAMGLYEYTAANWPELLPPVYPRGVDPTKPMTAVTYDDGPNATYTPLLLDILEKYGAVATFFEVGYRVERWPQFIPRMEALHCEVANHTWDHAALRQLSREGVVSQIQRTDAAIEAVTGHKVNLVRCPGGNSNETVAEAVGHPIIYWTIDTRDWEVRVASNVIAHVKNHGDLDGDIILMHSNYLSTVEASRTIIPYILNKGYQTVTVTELAFFRGVELQNGVTYKKFPPQ